MGRKKQNSARIAEGFLFSLDPYHRPETTSRNPLCITKPQTERLSPSLFSSDPAVFLAICVLLMYSIA